MLTHGDTGSIAAAVVARESFMTLVMLKDVRTLLILAHLFTRLNERTRQKEHQQ
jgi:hypothetical protein